MPSAVWILSKFEGSVVFISYGKKILGIHVTVGPQNTRPQASRTLKVHIFRLGPKIFEMHKFDQERDHMPSAVWLLSKFEDYVVFISYEKKISRIQVKDTDSKGVKKN